MKYPKEKILDIISEKTGIWVSKIKPEDGFVENLGFDSLETVELFIELEKNLKISIPDEEMEKINTIKDLFSYLDKL